MAYEDLKKEAGRHPAYIAEIYLQRCTLTYGTPPCSAAVGTTGFTKCFNTLGTCQDEPNFDPDSTEPLRFSSQRIDELQQAGEPPTFPTLLTVDTTPTRLEPGKGLGIRSSVTIRLQDHPWTDVGIDPYLGDASRAVSDPDSVGSFWGKMLARVKYWEGRRLDILTGYLDPETGVYDASNFLRRTFVIEEVAGPDRRGNVSIIAKDPLKFADSNRTQVPELTRALLDSDIDDNPATVTVPVGVGEGALFSIGDFIRIDEEVCEVINVVSDDLTVDRATLPSFYPASGTLIDEHTAGATVQICRLYDNERVDDIISDLLINEVGIDPSFIDLVEWADIFDEQIPSYIFSTLITEPTGVKDLLQELTEHTILLWWDERDQEIKFEVLRPTALTLLPTFDDDSNIVADSFASNRTSKERLSRVYTYHGQRDPTKSLDQKNNYQKVNIRIDVDAESDEQYGSARARDIFSRWLTTAETAIADEIGQRLLVEYRNTKTAIQFVIDPKDDSQWTGDFVKIASRYIQDQEGQPTAKQFRIVEVAELLTKLGAKYKYVAIQTQLSGRAGVWAPDEEPPGTPYPDYTAATEEERLRAYWCGEDGLMSNGDTGYVWT